MNAFTVAASFIEAADSKSLCYYMYPKGQKGQVSIKVIHLIHVKREMKWKVREIWGTFDVFCGQSLYIPVVWLILCY